MNLIPKPIITPTPSDTGERVQTALQRIFAVCEENRERARRVLREREDRKIEGKSLWWKEEA